MQPITEPTGRGVAWSEERGTSDEGKGEASRPPHRRAEDTASGEASGDRTSLRRAAPVLVTRLGRQQRIFPVGTQIRVGRDPSLELVSVNPLVSRHCHGVITSDEDGATYTDQSRRGSFLNGKQLHGTAAHHRVGDAAPRRSGHRRGTGHHAPAQQHRAGPQPGNGGSWRGRIRLGALVAAAVVVAGGIAAVVLAAIGSPAPAASQAAAR